MEFWAKTLDELTNVESEISAKALKDFPGKPWTLQSTSTRASHNGISLIAVLTR